MFSLRTKPSQDPFSTASWAARPVQRHNARCGYRIDLLLDGQLVVEIKSVEQLLRIHQAQVLTYMKLANVRIGLLNFNVEILKKGVKRLVL
jgi:GxxExxY protein